MGIAISDEAMSIIFGEWVVVVLRYTVLFLVTMFIFRRDILESSAMKLKRVSQSMWMNRRTLNESDIVDFNLRKNKEGTMHRDKKTTKRGNKPRTKCSISSSVYSNSLTTRTAEGKHQQRSQVNELPNQEERYSPMLSTSPAAAELDDFTIIQSRAAVKARKRCEYRNNISHQPRKRSDTETNSSWRTRSDSETTALGESFTQISTPGTERTLVDDESMLKSDSREWEDFKVQHSDIGHLLVGMKDQGLPAVHSRVVSMNLDIPEHKCSQRRSRSVDNRPLFLWPPE